eukprot:13728.XXX_1061386_1061529_1 [CDS] Oithona nana genome sequencing.
MDDCCLPLSISDPDQHDPIKLHCSYIFPRKTFHDLHRIHQKNFWMQF